MSNHITVTAHQGDDLLMARTFYGTSMGLPEAAAAIARYLDAEGVRHHANHAEFEIVSAFTQVPIY